MSYFIYLTLLALAFIFSIWSKKSDQPLRIFPVLLLFSVLAEATVFVLVFVLGIKPQYLLVYHLYIPIEYTLLSMYFARTIKGRKTMIAYFILLGVVISLCVYLSLHRGFFSFPGMNLNVAGVVLIVWSVVALFTIKPVVNTAIYKIPVFWISIGFLVYYSGSFFHNFIYEYLKMSENKLAESLNDIINKGSNDVLYICLSIAFICSNRLMKST
ncbi:MAG: hypothetical protein C0523_07260 [Cytophaga sp.]|nr:hypothetical protein [Cytophaga sp.]